MNLLLNVYHKLLMIDNIFPFVFGLSFLVIHDTKAKYFIFPSGNMLRNKRRLWSV